MRSVIIGLFIIVSFSAFAQTNPSVKRWESGLLVGSGMIFGELKSPKFGPRVGIYSGLHLNRYLLVEAQCGTGQFRSHGDVYTNIDFDSVWKNTDPYICKGDVNLSSKTSWFNLNFGLQFYPVPSLKNKLSVTIKAGIGMASFHSVVTFIDLRKFFPGDYWGNPYKPTPNPNYGAHVTESYDGRHWTLPLSLDFSYKITEKYYAGLQLQYVFVRSDDIDVMNDQIWSNKYFDAIGNALIKFGYAF